MQVKLKNVGDAMRVVYDIARNMVSIPIGKERSVDLHEAYIARLRAAQEKGDTLHVSSATARVRIEKPGDPLAEKSTTNPMTTIVGRPLIGRPSLATKAGPATEPIKEDTVLSPVEALAQFENLPDYHAKLGMVLRTVPENDLPPRPTSAQMLDVLRKAAAKTK